MFKYYNQKKHMKRTAHDIYGSIVTQTRMPVFYANWRIPDTIEGRFEVLVLHMTLVLFRLNNEKQESSRELGRLVAEAFIDDMDDSFREMGVGDLAVPKRMKKASEAYYGRLHAYSAALEDGNRAVLEEALRRNISPGEELEPLKMNAIADYMLRSSVALSGQKFETIKNSLINFADFQPLESEGNLTGEVRDDGS